MRAPGATGVADEPPLGTAVPSALALSQIQGSLLRAHCCAMRAALSAAGAMAWAMAMMLPTHPDACDL